MTDNGIAQICLNGHVLTSMSNDSLIAEPFCSKCGASIINKCQDCNTPIKGSRRVSSVIEDPPYHYPSIIYHKPSFCFKCSHTFSWTTRIKDAANELINFSENLSLTEKDDLKNSISDLLIESPETNLSTIKFKTYVAKAGTEIGKGLKDILIDLVSETVKKSIWG